MMGALRSLLRLFPEHGKNSLSHKATSYHLWPIKLANTRCELSQARWEFSTTATNRTGAGQARSTLGLIDR